MLCNLSNIVQTLEMRPPLYIFIQPVTNNEYDNNRTTHTYCYVTWMVNWVNLFLFVTYITISIKFPKNVVVTN